MRTSVSEKFWSENSQQGYITCDWQRLSDQLLDQWRRITRQELEQTHHERLAIARLIERKHGVNARLVENYLRNVERTLPLFN